MTYSWAILLKLGHEFPKSLSINNYQPLLSCQPSTIAHQLGYRLSFNTSFSTIKNNSRRAMVSCARPRRWLLWPRTLGLSPSDIMGAQLFPSWDRAGMLADARNVTIWYDILYHTILFCECNNNIKQSYNSDIELCYIIRYKAVLDYMILSQLYHIIWYNIKLYCVILSFLTLY